MSYSEYQKEIFSSEVSILGENYNQPQLEEWYNALSLNGFENTIKSVFSKWYDDSLEFEISTSGSTGTPKIIQLKKEKMYASAKNSLAYFKLKKNQKILLAIPADKVGGIMLIIRAIIGNLDLHFIEPKLDPFVSLKEKSFSFCSLTPSQLLKIHDNPDSVKKLNKIQKILLGGAAITDKLMTIIQQSNNKFYHSYGMTETISHVAIRPLNGNLKKDYFEAIGKATFTTNNKFQLIVNDPEILEEPLLTNDIVELIGPKKLIWKGRIDNIINSGGIKLIIEELEKKIGLTIKETFYLVGIPDPVFGEKLILLIQGNDTSAINENNYKDKLTKILPKHEVPKEIIFVPKFKYTENGKLLRLLPSQLSHS